MITRNTVFVLGAGASCPYGFPTGNGLRNMLCGTLMDESTGTFQRLRDLGYNPGAIRHFAQAFLGSRRVSIDAFLAHRADFHDVGVAAIANALLPLETMEGLDRAGSNIGDGDWYQYLFELMLGGVQRAEDFAGNKLRFITFNYDRSLEVFLLTGLQHTFNLELGIAHSLLPQIHHVYGSLGEYDERIGFRYGQAGPDRIRYAASLIKTVPSTRPEIDETASEWLKEAEMVYFVGFGFDEMNCRRLGVADLVAARAADRRQTNLSGTSLGMTPAEETLAKRRTGCEGGHGSLSLFGLNALAFVRTLAHQLT